MTVIYDTLPGNVGVLPRTQEVRLTAHAAITQGLTYMIDTKTATAANFGIADTTESVAVAEALNEEKIFVVALEDVDSGKVGRFALSGYVEVTANGTGFTAGDALTIDVDGEIGEATVLSTIVIGLAVDDVAADAKGKIWFEGTGFSTRHSI